MIRSILPVGQGNFSIEIFANLNVVFDCGSNKIEDVKEEIDKNFNEKDVINAVFVSHLDKDHINGLDHLIERCDVKKIFIPYLSKEEKMLVIIEKRISSNDKEGVFSKFVLESSFSNERVLFKPRDNEKQEVEIIEIPEYDKESNNSEKNWEKATRGLFKDVDWGFFPFNFKEGERGKQFHDAIRSHPELKELNNSNISDKWEENKGKLKDIYHKEVEGNINGNSMVVYSGPTKNAKKAYSICGYGSYISVRTGALYMGDYNASKKINSGALVEYLKNYKKMIGLITVPHHGSKHSFGEELLTDCNVVYAIQYGDNSYGHPDKEVVLAILNRRMPLVLVNKDSSPFTQVVEV